MVSLPDRLDASFLLRAYASGIAPVQRIGTTVTTGTLKTNSMRTCLAMQRIDDAQSRMRMTKTEPAMKW